MLYQLSYRGSSAGRGSNLHHNTTQGKCKPQQPCYGTTNSHSVCVHVHVHTYIHSGHAHFQYSQITIIRTVSITRENVMSLVHLLVLETSVDVWVMCILLNKSQCALLKTTKSRWIVFSVFSITRVFGLVGSRLVRSYLLYYLGWYKKP